MEWYFGYKFPHNDLNCENFRSREKWYQQSTIATQFVRKFQVEQMKCQDELVNIQGAYCLAKSGEVYLVYLPACTTNAGIRVELDKPLSVKWFKANQGGEYQECSITRVEGVGNKVLGYPPSDPELDWVIVIQ